MMTEHPKPSLWQSTPLDRFPYSIASRAYEIVIGGAGIPLPFNVGDAGVRFASRWELAQRIAEALSDAEETGRQDTSY